MCWDGTTWPRVSEGSDERSAGRRAGSRAGGTPAGTWRHGEASRRGRDLPCGSTPTAPGDLWRRPARGFRREAPGNPADRATSLAGQHSNRILDSRAGLGYRAVTARHPAFALPVVVFLVLHLRVFDHPSRCFRGRLPGAGIALVLEAPGPRSGPSTLWRRGSLKGLAANGPERRYIAGRTRGRCRPGCRAGRLGGSAGSKNRPRATHDFTNSAVQAPRDFPASGRSPAVEQAPGPTRHTRLTTHATLPRMCASWTRQE